MKCLDGGSRVKVIQIMPRFMLGGAEIMCENLTVELKKKGVEVIAVSMFDYHSEITQRMEEAGIPVVYLGKKPGLDLNMIRRMVSLFKKEKPDAIHTHLYVMQYAIPAAVIAGVRRRVHTFHSIASKETTPSGQKLNNLFYHYLHVVPVGLSKEVRRTIMERYHLKASRIPVVFNGIPLERCIVKSDYSCKDRLEFLHIGRFVDVKNHRMLVEAFQMLLAKGYQAHLTLVGTGELYDEVCQQAEALGLSDEITFYGTTGNVYPLLHEADAFVLPSVYEGMPMTLLEAMGTGLPIVASEVGGIPDMLEKNQEALLVPVTAKDLLQGMIRMYDQTTREALGKAARRRVCRDFSAERMAEHYIKLYK